MSPIKKEVIDSIDSPKRPDVPLKTADFSGSFFFYSDNLLKPFPQIIHNLETISDDVFTHHVHEEIISLSDFIKIVVKDKGLSMKVKQVRKRQEFIKLLNRHEKLLSKFASSSNNDPHNDFNSELMRLDQVLNPSLVKAPPVNISASHPVESIVDRKHRELLDLHSELTKEKAIHEEKKALLENKTKYLVNERDRVQQKIRELHKSSIELEKKHDALDKWLLDVEEKQKKQSQIDRSIRDRESALEKTKLYVESKEAEISSREKTFKENERSVAERESTLSIQTKELKRQADDLVKQKKIVLDEISRLDKDAQVRRDKVLGELALAQAEKKKINGEILVSQKDLAELNSKIDYSYVEIERLRSHMILANDQEVKAVLVMADDLLGKLPDNIIDRFVKSPDFALYRKVLQSVKGGG